MPGLVTERDAAAAIRAGRVDPVYLLVGDDHAGMAPLIAALTGVVPEDIRGFNVERVHARRHRSRRHRRRRAHAASPG